ncbi:MAG TPA: hypothetical protein VLQ93_01110 [Myxococcaceae bacterium]|nr:hypothetical protein [Myxococcaceae bacterium]
MGKKQTFFIIVGVCGGLLYGASELIGWSEHGAPEPTPSESSELVQLREQVRKLESSVARSEKFAREARSTARIAQLSVSTRADAPPAPEGVPAVAGQGASHEEAVTEGPGAEPPPPSTEEIITRMDARFFGEGFDPSWSYEARERAEQLGTRMPEGSRVVSLECRSSMCRMEMSHPNLESFQDFMQKSLLGGESEWDGPFMAGLKGDPGQPGELVAVAYLARAGADLSPPPGE